MKRKNGQEKKERIKNMNWTPARIMGTTSFLLKTQNWKITESDKIPNYRLKAFPATHS
jgi:hypothetical protein